MVCQMACLKGVFEGIISTFRVLLFHTMRWPLFDVRNLDVGSFQNLIEEG